MQLCKMDKNTAINAYIKEDVKKLCYSSILEVTSEALNGYVNSQLHMI